MADISSIKLPNNSTYEIKAKKIYYAECATASTDIAKVVACDGFVLEKGAIIAIRFTDTGNTNPASGNISLNINGTGAKNIVPKGSNTILTYSWGWAFRVNQTWIFVYNGTYFVWLNQDNNTTYNPMTLGFGYGACTTAEATAAKVATLASYALVKNGIVAIKFSYAVPANATLNINNRGAKPIYYRGAKISADVIDKGDIATFVYDGANYQLLSIDSNNPSTRIDITSKTVDLNDLTLSSGVCHIRRYIEKTSGGAANISNLPDKLKGQPFVLDVELIRLGAVNTDYITIQTIKGVGDMANEYYRWCQNGVWKDWIKRVFTDTTYSNATASVSGLMSAEDKAKLDSIEDNANNYTHPTYTSQSSGLYKITVDNMGHISNVASVSKSDITALGIPSTDTTYNVATTTTDGLLSAADKKKLDSISSSSNSTVDLLFEGTLSSSVSSASSAQLTYSKVSQYKTIIIASSINNYSVLGVISSFPAPAQSSQSIISYSNSTVTITIREISGNSYNMSYSLSVTSVIASVLGTVRIWGFKI